MPKPKKPDYYKTPLKSRKAIADYLENVGGYYSSRDGQSYFSFNVKCYPDLSLDNLKKVYKESYGDHGDSDEVIDSTYNKYEGHLFEWGLKDSRRAITEDDCYKTLWDGTNVDVKYCFMGRSSGYVGISEFEGYDLTRDEETVKNLISGNPFKRGTEDYDYFNNYESEMTYKEVVKLYKLVVMLEYDLTSDNATKAVEHCAAHALFWMLE